MKDGIYFIDKKRRLWRYVRGTYTLVKEKQYSFIKEDKI
jgi:hypothetical protein